MRNFDTIIIGGGVAGLSTAYFLAKNGQKSVLVLEQEKKLGGHASGRNAGMLRQALSDPVLVDLAVQSQRFYSRASKQGWKNLNLQTNGSLLLSTNEDIEELRKIETTIQMFGINPRWLSKKEVAKKVSILENGNFDHALFCPTDAMVDIEALLQGFLGYLKTQGISVFCGKSLETVHRADGGFLVQAGNQKWFTQKIVNAAGAWAGWVAEKVGATEIPLMAYRRHLFFASTFHLPPSTFFKWPFVWDISHHFYFRPLENKIMFSPCDKTPEKLGNRREKVNLAMRKVLDQKLKNFSERLASFRMDKVKSGLRTMTPDGRFVIGEDTKIKNFYWVAGLGGHGVTTCFSVGKLAADMILGKKVNHELKKALSPERFLSVSLRGGPQADEAISAITVLSHRLPRPPKAAGSQ